MPVSAPIATPSQSQGSVAKWLCSGLQSRPRRFDSGPSLQPPRLRVWTRWWQKFAEVAAAVEAGLNPRLAPGDAVKVITFSHFLPRLGLAPPFVPRQHRVLEPVLGSTRLDRQLRALESSMHVYGHSHINRRARIDGVTYINNAFGYPGEGGISAKQLLCIDEI